MIVRKVEAYASTILLNIEMPLLAFLFGTPLAAAGVLAGAASIPLIIHLLNRKRYRIVPWAAMRFLLAAHKKNTRRLRLEQILLLALRTLLIVVVVAAMASVMPWAEAAWHALFPESLALAIPRTQRTHRILVLDGSLSMATRSGDGSFFEKAKALAEQVVGEAPRGDGFSVVLMSSPARRIVPEASEDVTRVEAEIHNARLPHGNADLLSSLALVDELLSQSPAKFEGREVYFFSDMQQASWAIRQPPAAAGLLQKIQARARMILVDVGLEGIANTAITHLEVGSGLVTTNAVTAIKASINYFGSEPRDSVPVEMWVGKAARKDGDKSFKEDFRLAYQENRKLVRGLNTLSIPYKFSSPGDYAVQIRLGPDALELDDVRTAVIRVQDEVPVFLVNGKPAADPWNQATAWLRLALNPFEAKNPQGVLKPRVLTEAQFADPAAGDLTPCDCVFLCDVARPSLVEIRRLETHVKSGGAVVICLGDNCDRGWYNENLYRQGAGLLPARLLGKQDAPSSHHFQFSLDAATELPAPLQAFTDERDRSSLLQPRFTSYIRTEPAKMGGARTILSFLPQADKPGDKPPETPLPIGDAAIIEWRPLLVKTTDAKSASPAHARGRVILITTTVNGDWSTWPATRGYLPLMQELVRYAVEGRIREQSIEVGEPLEEFMQGQTAALPAEIHTPDRTEAVTTQLLEEAGVLRFGDTDVSGIYWAAIGKEAREYLFAVNVPTAGDSQHGSESDPARTSLDELQRLYPEWEFQWVSDLKAITASTASSSKSEAVERPLGPLVGRILLFLLLGLLVLEVVLARRFGHHSAVQGEYESAGAPSWRRLLVGSILFFLAMAQFLVVIGAAGILIHYFATGDFLGFLPEGPRRNLENTLHIPAPAAGEGSHWRLEFSSLFGDGHADVWIAGLMTLAASAVVIWIYRHEGSRLVTSKNKLLLAALRIGFVLIIVVVLLPQLSLHFERESWPEVVLLFDDSQSMSTVDQYQDEAVLDAATQLAQLANLTNLERLSLAKALATRPEEDWLRALIQDHRVKIQVYHCSTRASRVAEASEPGELAKARQAIGELHAGSANDSSQLGAAVRQVLNDHRGSSLAALIMFTDGITTEGEDLVKASKHAAKMAVPLFFVGLGDARESKDIRLHDLQVEDTVFEGDTLIFDVRLSGPGYGDAMVPVQLYEKGKDAPLKTEKVKVERDGKPKKVTLTHRATEKGQKTFIIKVPPQPGETQLDNNIVERDVEVREAKLIKVLYVEGYPRYEYRFLKTLLERESARNKGNKSIELKVLLASADSQWVSQDKSAISEFPSRTELEQYDVVVLGDVDPRAGLKIKEGLRNLADFVRERGGGLLMIGGVHHAPAAYWDTPLKDILPIEKSKIPAGPEPADGYREGYRPELTAVGRIHPIFRFSSEESDNENIWGLLAELYWFGRGYQAKRASEVMAVFPKARDHQLGASEAGPLAVQAFVGNGRSMFFGFDETWRWQFRQDKIHFNQFWIQTVRYLAHSRLGKLELRLDRQTPYRRGEPIKVMVRFPEDRPAPAVEVPVKVVAERVLVRPGGAPETEVQTMTLAKVEGSRATYEALLTRTPEGDYRFWLSEPSADGEKPRAECRVLAPPGEMEHLRMNQADMEKAAAESHGKFYTLAEAGNLLGDLPSGTRMTFQAPGPPLLLWNHGVLFVLVILLITTEWLMRKRWHLL